MFPYHHQLIPVAILINLTCSTVKDTLQSFSMIFKFLLAANLMACWVASDVTGDVTYDPISGKATGVTCPIQGGFFPFPGDCSKFIQCFNGIPIFRDCPPDLEFNPTLKVCDSPKDAGCTAESTETTPAATTAAPDDTTKPATTTEYPYEEEEYYTTKKY